MTKSTGKRDAQKRREELFAAELRLRRVLLHLLAAHAWARRCCQREKVDPIVLAEYLGVDAAYRIVRKRLQRVCAAERALA
jgi:hypothetical protein